jgi:hypothetical protein
MFDYQLDFTEPTHQINSEEDFRKITRTEDLETWCRETQRCKELDHASQELNEEPGQDYHKLAALSKSHLPKIMWQATFPYRRRKKEEALANGLFILDWDGIFDKSVEEALEGVKEKYRQQGKDFIRDEKVMVIHWTPSRHGIRLVCQANINLDIGGNQKALAERMGIPENQFDSSVKDLSRVSYAVPYDDNWTVYLDKAVFTFFNEEYSKRWSTLGRNEAEPTVVETQPEPLPQPTEGTELDYIGIPYSVIIKRWWKLYNGGVEPMKSNRNTLIFELACNLRHICGFSRDLLNRVIPNYDGFPQEEKMQCIDNALKERRSRMPARLTNVLNSIKAENIDNPEIIQAMDDMEEQDEMFYLEKMQALPLGVRDSLEGVKPSLGMPIIIAIGPAIGGLATGVRLNVHGKFKHLNLQAYVVGEAGSDKSEIGPIFDLWTWKVREEDKVAHKIEEDYEEQARMAKNSKQQPKNPHPAVRYQSMRTSNAMLLYRLKYSGGKHLISFTSESDLFSQNARQSWADTSVLVRLAYDGDKYSSDYKSDSAVNGVIDEVLWNMALCCTPDALYRSVRNYTNGEVTRLAIARTPDNTFSPLVNYGQRSEKAEQNIKTVGELLMFMQGDVELPELENRCQEWLEKIRLSKLKNFDRIGAQLRMRAAVTAMRYTCCLMLCSYVEWLLDNMDRKNGFKCKWTHGCKTAIEFLKAHPNAVEQQLPQFQTEEMLSNFEVIADYIMDNLEFYFKDKIQNAKESSNYVIGERVLQGKNDDFYSQLSEEFTAEDARKIRGSEATPNAVKQMLKNWRKQGLIKTILPGRYRKLV